MTHSIPSIRPTALPDTAAEPEVAKLRGLPRVVVWVALIAAPWAVIHQIVTLIL